jgi:hypothetical protein
MPGILDQYAATSYRTPSGPGLLTPRKKPAAQGLLGPRKRRPLGGYGPLYGPNDRDDMIHPGEVDYGAMPDRSYQSTIDPNMRSGLDL